MMVLAPPVSRMTSMTVFSNSTTATYYPLVVATNPLPFAADREAQDGMSMLIGGFFLYSPSPTNGSCQWTFFGGGGTSSWSFPSVNYPRRSCSRAKASVFLLPLGMLFILPTSSEPYICFSANFFCSAELPLAWLITTGINPVAICIPLFPPGQTGCRPP